MPTTIRRDQRDNFVIGVDGCRGGCVIVRLKLDDQGAIVGVEPAFRAILNGSVAEQAG